MASFLRGSSLGGGQVSLVWLYRVFWKPYDVMEA